MNCMERSNRVWFRTRCKSGRASAGGIVLRHNGLPDGLPRPQITASNPLRPPAGSGRPLGGSFDQAIPHLAPFSAMPAPVIRIKKRWIPLVLMLLLASPAPAARPPDTVVVMHGLLMGGWIMTRIECALEEEGYRVVNLSYSSRTMPLEEIATRWLPEQLEKHDVLLDRESANGAAVHFVTHSMGGIIVRLWLRDCGVPASLERVVMLAPPNQGAPLVDLIGDWRIFGIITGVNGRRLGTDEDSLPQQLGPWPDGPELGIITGDNPLIPFSGWLTGSPTDGQVPVARSKLEGMADHIVLPYSHTSIVLRREPIQQAIHFLQHGAFDPTR